MTPGAPTEGTDHGVRGEGLDDDLAASLAVHDELIVERAWAGRAQRIELWSWRPGGGAYTGLPRDEVEAIARRQERITVTTRQGDVTASPRWRERRPFTIDLRAG